MNDVEDTLTEEEREEWEQRMRESKREKTKYGDRLNDDDE